MKRRTKTLLCLVLALILLLAAGCSKQSDAKSFVLLLEGVADRGGVVLEGITPGMSKEEAVAAGLVLAKEPYKTSDDESGRSSETYPVKNAISLGKIAFKGPEFQFMNGKLVDITMTANDESGAKDLLEQLKKELGEPTIQNNNSAEAQYWEIDQSEYMLRISYLPKNVSGKMYATLMVSYLYYEWFPNLKK